MLKRNHGLSLVEVMVASAVLAVMVLGVAQFFSYFQGQLAIQRKQSSAQNIRMMMGFYSFSTITVQRSALIASLPQPPSNPTTTSYAPGADGTDDIANEMLKKCLEIDPNGDPQNPAQDCIALDSNGTSILYSLWLTPSGKLEDLAARGTPLGANETEDQNPGLYYDSFGTPCPIQTAPSLLKSDCTIVARTWFTVTCATGAANCAQAATIDLKYNVANKKP